MVFWHKTLLAITQALVIFKSCKYLSRMSHLHFQMPAGMSHWSLKLSMTKTEFIFYSSYPDSRIVQMQIWPLAGVGLGQVTQPFCSSVSSCIKVDKNKNYLIEWMRLNELICVPSYSIHYANIIFIIFKSTMSLVLFNFANGTMFTLWLKLETSASSPIPLSPPPPPIKVWVLWMLLLTHLLNFTSFLQPRCIILYYYSSPVSRASLPTILSTFLLSVVNIVQNHT